MPAIPSPVQLNWSEQELGILYHLDTAVCDPDHRIFNDIALPPPASVFNPAHLDMDQWLDAATAMGARYAVLVAKHNTGFCLWPSADYGYTVAHSPWRNGRGDLVGDFVTACRRHGVKPGLYYSTSVNQYLGIGWTGGRRPEAPSMAEFNRLVERQCTELWRDYGELFEIWFDGGIVPVEQGGPDLLPLIQRYQPKAALFQGMVQSQNNLRWPGNEQGVLPPDCWSSYQRPTTQEGGLHARAGFSGDPEAAFWCPAEVDMPIRHTAAREAGWFWAAGQDHLVKDPEQLFARYLTTVGRNGNLLLGATPDSTGRIPAADMAAYRGFAQLVAERLGKPAGAVTDVVPDAQGVIELKLDAWHELTFIEIMEDQTLGHAVRGWTLEAMDIHGWLPIDQGQCIGHKRLVPGLLIRTERIRLTITRSAGPVRIRRLAAHVRHPG